MRLNCARLRIADGTLSAGRRQFRAPDYGSERIWIVLTADLMENRRRGE
jgi:hypothetical protein